MTDVTSAAPRRPPRKPVPDWDKSPPTALGSDPPGDVEEWNPKPQRVKMVTSRGVTASGRPYVVEQPAPGYQLAFRISFQNPDGSWEHKLKVRRSRGRPGNSQSKE